ncbi:MAG: GyrI-like domain-containing protein [Myxococcota bacterium]
MPGGTYATTTHVGPYDARPSTYAELLAFSAAARKMPKRDAYEVYFDPP